MEIILLIVLGGLAGWIVSIIMRTREGVLGNIILGIVGALVGGLIMNLIGQPGVTGFNLYSLLVAIIGAAVVIYVGRIIYHH